MGRSIVKQQNGLYSCWSSIIDNFVFTDATKEEYIEYRAKEVYENKKEELISVFDNPMKNKSSFKDHDKCMEILERTE